MTIRADDDAAGEYLDTLLGGFATALSSPGRARVGEAEPAEIVLSTTRRGFLVSTSDGSEEPAPTVTSAVAQALHRLDVTVVEDCRGHLRLHAGAVELDGRVVIVAGASQRGKSTLTAALVQRGFGYLTDEVVVVEPETIRVRPYPKALDLWPRAVELLRPPVTTLDLGLRKVKVPPASLGRVSSGGSVSALVLLDGAPSSLPDDVVGDAPVVESVSPSEAMVALLPCTFEQSVADMAGFAALGRLCEAVPTVRLRRSSLPTMIAEVQSLLDGSEFR